MEKNHEANKPRQNALKHFLFEAKLPLENETCWFILMGVFDLVLTFLLLRTGTFREANLLARFFIFAGGLKGLIYFKFATVAVVVVIIQIIARHRLETARALLRLGIALQFFVTVYSASLLLQSSLRLARWNGQIVFAQF